MILQLTNGTEIDIKALYGGDKTRTHGPFVVHKTLYTEPDGTPYLARGKWTVSHKMLGLYMVKGLPDIEQARAIARQLAEIDGFLGVQTIDDLDEYAVEQAMNVVGAMTADKL